MVFRREALEVGEIVHPPLRDAERSTGSRLPLWHDGAIVLLFWYRVACAVDETGQIEAVAVNERRRLARDGHVAGHRIAESELCFPAEVLLV